jgi:hypothetical protein
VLVATGLSLFLEASAKQTAGIVLLGLAATWLLGSLPLRLLGFLSCFLAFAAGVAVLGVCIYQVHSSYRDSVQDYDAAIAEIRQAVDKSVQIPKLPKGYELDKPIGGWEFAHPDQMSESSEQEVEFPEVAGLWLRPDSRLAHDWNFRPDEARYGAAYTYGLVFPGNESDDDMQRDIETDFLQPRPSFSVWAALTAHRMSFVGGAAMIVLGLLGSGLLFARRPRPDIPATP